MSNLKVNGIEYQVSSNEAKDLTKVSDKNELENLIPGYYKIKLHENLGSKELVVKVLNSIVLERGVIMIVIIDCEDDYTDVLYWNGGWKFNQEHSDSLEDWIEWFDFSFDDGDGPMVSI